MDRTEFRLAFEPLCLVFRVTFDVTDWTVYFQALEDIPVLLLDAAIQRIVRENRRFIPRPGEVREIAESCRRQLVAANPWTPCDLCADLSGFVEVTDEAGVKRLARCRCRNRHAERLLSQGIPTQSLVLPSSTSDGEDAFV